MGRIFWLVFICFLPRAHAFTETVTSTGAPVRWSTQRDQGFHFNLAGNPSNSVGMSASDFYNAVVRSLHRWNTASSGEVSFDYWQGTDPSIYEANSNYNGLSSIYFASNAKVNQSLSANVLGLTQVWYNTSTGQILEADTVLNDKDFRFTTNPADTSGFGSAYSSFNGSNRVYIENVLTHEFGHSLGFSHAAGSQSTMLFMESPEQAHLGCDEQIGIHAMYPSGDRGARGSISGVVTAPSGVGVFGANVVAISRRRGVVLSSALTNSSGQYKISGLEAGTYFLLAEPYYAGSQPLPTFYSGMNPDVCSNSRVFGRTVLTDGSGNRAIPLNVPGGGSTGAPPLVVGCNSGGAAINSQAGSLTIYNALTDGSGFGIADRFSETQMKSYKLKGLSGHVEIRTLSYSLYSPISLSMNLTDAGGNPVVGIQTSRSAYQGDSGYVDYDGTLVADGLAYEDYYLQVEPQALSSLLYPAGSIPGVVDSIPFMVITGSVNEGAPSLASLPLNARCRMDESFAAYQSPPGNPPRGLEDDSKSSAKVGFCGTIESMHGPRGTGGPGSGPGGGAILGWLLPWIAMGGIAKVSSRNARARSAFPASFPALKTLARAPTRR